MHCFSKRDQQSSTSRVEKCDLSCPGVVNIFHTLHFSSSFAWPWETNFQSVLYSFFWQRGRDIGNLDLPSGNIKVDLCIDNIKHCVNRPHEQKYDNVRVTFNIGHYMLTWHVTYNMSGYITHSTRDLGYVTLGDSCRCKYDAGNKLRVASALLKMINDRCLIIDISCNVNVIRVCFVLIGGWCS